MNTDVMVIGAGPAGALAAFALARAGLAVTLADKAAFPRTKVCGCCLGPAAAAALERHGLGDLPARCGAVPVHTLELAHRRTRAAVPVSGWAVLSRARLDAELAREAERAGALFRRGCEVRVGGVGDDAVSLRIGGDDARAAVVLAADGLAGRTFAADAEPGARVGAGVAFADDSAYEPGRVYMASAEGGYVGAARLEDGRLNLAAAFDASFLRACGGPGAAAARVLAAVGWPVPRDLAGQPWRGTPALTRSARRAATPRVFALGDAIGYVEPFTGEGTARALESAGDVVPWVERAVRSWDDALAEGWVDFQRTSRKKSRRLIDAVAWSVRRPWVFGPVLCAARAAPVTAGRVIDHLLTPRRTGPLPPSVPARTPAPRTAPVPAAASAGPG